MHSCFVTRRYLAVGLGLLLSSCTGSGGTRALIRVKAEPTGLNCGTGGSRIETGLDVNGNGELDPAEVTDTQFVCNGAMGPEGSMGQPGEAAASVLVQTLPEPAGMNCVNGGQRVFAGADTNGNGVLDLSEVSVTSYVCDGAPGPGIKWVTVTGAAQQAAANTGYLANNPTARVVITLPTSPAMGEIVQVTGVGDGGFFIAQNAGQVIDGRNLGVAPGASWKARSTGLPAVKACGSIASSSDGRKLATACVDTVYTSNDSGATWMPRGMGLPSNLSTRAFIASSSDGAKLVLLARQNTASAQIWISSDRGTSWVPSTLPVAAQWASVAVSADGTRVVLVGSEGQIFTSADSGGTWTSRSGAPGLPMTVDWSVVAASQDGTRIAVSGPGFGVFTSADNGATWTPPSAVSGLPMENWRSLASSADGRQLAIVAWGSRIWISTNFGSSWTPRDAMRGWMSVASSSDGTVLVAASTSIVVGGGGSFTSVGYDQLYVSSDSGATWAARDSRREWVGLACSADGSRLAAVALGDGAFTSSLETTRGILGGVAGSQADALTLQHIGSGTFTVLEASGSGFALE